MSPIAAPATRQPMAMPAAAPEVTPELLGGGLGAGVAVSVPVEEALLLVEVAVLLLPVGLEVVDDEAVSAGIVCIPGAYAVVVNAGP